MTTNINDLGRFRDALRKTRNFRKDAYSIAIPPHGVPADVAAYIVERYNAAGGHTSKHICRNYHDAVNWLCRPTDRGMGRDLIIMHLISRGWQRDRLDLLLDDMVQRHGALVRLRHTITRARAIGKLSLVQFKGYLAYHRDNSCAYPVKRCAALGLLPYYARCVAELDDDRKVVDWQGARQAMRSVEAIRDPERADLLRRAYICLHEGHERHRDMAFAPAYPGLRGYPAAMIATGRAKPAELLPGMTSAEAHDLLSRVDMGGQAAHAAVSEAVALSEMVRQAVGAYLADCDIETQGQHGHVRMRASTRSTGRRYALAATTYRCDELAQICDEDTHIRPRSILTAKWFVNVCADPDKLDTLIRPRVERGPRGETAAFRLLDRADEIDDQDLNEGVNTPVIRAFERAAERMIQDHVREYGDDPLCDVPLWWHDVPGVRLLRTARELAIEGRELDHCVAGYAPYVQRGDCYILAIQTEAGRSTAEIFTASGELEIRQHYGTRNSTPSEANKELLRDFLTRGLQEMLRALGPYRVFGHRHIDHDAVFGREYAF